MALYCEWCGPRKQYPEGTQVCPRHFRELKKWLPPPDLPAEGAGTEPPDEDFEPYDPDYCWNCGASVQDQRNTICLECRKSLDPPAAQLRFPNGEIELERGDATVLGRHGPHHRVFRDHPNVSRRHARIGVDGAGNVWIEPQLFVLNGTFADGVELAPGRHTLRARTRLRLARDVDCELRIFRQDPQ